MRRVLVVPCGTEIGYELVRSLDNTKENLVYGANSGECYSDLPEERLSFDISFVNNSNFIHQVEALVKKWSITHVIPAHDSAALELTQFSDAISAKIVSSSYDTNSICRSKSLTYALLCQSVLVPKIYRSFENLCYPLFIKPDIGQGSIGTRIVKNENELFISEGELLCEYLPGDEYTVDCVTDANGTLIYAKARRRSQTRNGISVQSEIVTEQEPFLNFAGKINSTIKLRGAWFFQVKKNIDGELCLLEVATRIAGSMITSRFNGINFAELSLLVSDNVSISVIDNNLNVKLFRNLSYQFKTNLNYDVIYTDYDDCLLLKDKYINIDLIKLLYDAINNNKKVVLITRHAGDLNESLAKHRLSTIFDDVIHIKDNSIKKSDFINEPNSIFIDDSFSERRDVAMRHGIPCYSVDMIKGLTCIKS